MKKNTPKIQSNPVPKFRITHKNNKITSQAGLIPVGQFLRRLGFHEILEQELDIDSACNEKYSPKQIMFVAVIGIIGGARSITGILRVWNDRILNRLLGNVLIPHLTTLSRNCRKFKDAGVAQLESVNHKLRQRVWKEAERKGMLTVKEDNDLWVDVDSTVITSFGKQEGAEKGFNSKKKGARSYHPLMGFSTETKEILQGWFRCGSAYTSNGVVEFMKQLCANLPLNRRVMFRGDSGYFQGALLDFLEGKRFGFLIKVKLKGLTKLLMTQSWSAVKGQLSWEQCEFEHQCKAWTNKRKMIAVRCENKEATMKQKDSDQESLFDFAVYDYFCYVVSESWTPWKTHKTYGQRATSETWIEEAKNQVALGIIRTNSFLANAVFFQAAILSYNTMRWMGLCSGKKKLRKWEPQTLRAFLVRIAARLLTGSRKLEFRVTEYELYEEEKMAWFAIGIA